MSAAGTPAAQGGPLAQGSDADAAIAALRAGDGPRKDPIGFHYIEALARRTASHAGDARRLLDSKLAAALAAFGPAPDAAREVGAEGPSPACQTSPLAELVDQLRRRAATAGELKDLHFFRETWSGLRMRRQLTQSLAKLPENAGPLHSDRLVSRALQEMQALSPAYLSRYMGYVDALFWLNQVQGNPGLTPGKTVRADGDKRRKPVRAKPSRA